MRRNREEDFRAGLELLSPFFEAEGFDLVVYPPHEDDAGTFYSAQFTWSGRAVTLVHLFDLESVTYSIGQMMIEHSAYLDALGVKRDAAFPPSAEEPLAGYTALLSDLESRMTPFFVEPDRDFFEIAALHGKRGLPRIPGAERA